MVPAQESVGRCLATFKEFPQRPKAASFHLDDVMKTLGQGAPKPTYGAPAGSSKRRGWNGASSGP